MTQLHEIVLASDPNVTSTSGNIMSSADTLNYEQEGVFKYGFTGSEKQISFHSMIMYAYPEIREWLQGRKLKIKIQKGCINFKAFDLPAEDFQEMLELSAARDFSVVLKRYKK